MSKFDERLELAQWVVEQASKSGATEVRVSINRRRRQPRLSRAAGGEAGGVRRERTLLSLYVDGKYSAHRTSDLRRDALQSFVAQATGMTGYLEKDPYRYLPEPKYYEGRSDKDLDLVDPNYGALSAEDRHRMVQEVENAALEAGGDKIVSVEAGYYDAVAEEVTVSSNGFVGTTAGTNFWTGASVTAKDEGDKRPSDWCWEGGVHRGGIVDPVAIGKEAVSRSLARVGASKIATEKLPLVVQNRTTARLLRFMGNGLYGRNLQQKSSYLEGKQGEQIASPLLSIYDDPLIPRGFGSQLFDGEGIAAKRMPVIEKGVLKNYFIDTYYARKLGVEATTGGPSNVVFDYGDRSPEDWMKQLGRGILVTGFIGGNSNSSTGDFSTGIYGFLFDGGQIVKPVNELNIAGNHLEFWHKVIGIGNDPYTFSSWRTPSIVFDALTVAGA
ncbi:MAG: TldD/PmbA family protein [Candidatus Eisenbacteria bacterium]